MKAAQINEYGDKDVLKITYDAPKPRPTAKQVLVEVHAAAVNPFDCKVRAGLMKEMVELKFPATLGGDVAGVVSEVGDEVSDFKEGDEVYGQASSVGGEGSFAEFTAVRSASLALKPEGIDFTTAAAVPLAGASAYQALIDHAGMQKYQKVLIHGGAGGIGSFAIQIAKSLGAYVAATAATEDLDYAKELGADEVIDYKTQDFTDVVKDYDVVFDTVGGETFTKSHHVLRPQGVLVTMVGEQNDELAKEFNVQVFHQFSKVTTERLTKLAELIENGVLKINVDKTFPLDEAADALDYLQQGQHRGKVVLKVK